ncbi:integrase [Burkholderia ubonensis]|nr:integrase [Burkholderia ubonensis]
MLEYYFVKPATVDRILANVAGAYIEHYVSWLRAHGYADRNVFRRVPILCQFGEFASARGATDGQTALAHIEAFAQHWQSIHGKSCSSDVARAKVAHDARNPVRQMLELALYGGVGPHRQRKPFPFEAEVPGFAGYLRDERGLKADTIGRYAFYLTGLSVFLDGTGATSLASVSPPLLARFLVERCAGLARTTRRDLCGTLRVFLRYCHRERIVGRDLSAVVDVPRVHRLANLPRAITWDEVRDMLGCVDRRCALGRRDYAMLLLLVTYGLRGNEVAQLTLEDIDWRHERLNIPQRKAGHWSAYPLAGVVGEAIIDYLKNARPQTTDRHVFLRSMAPCRPITSAAVSSTAVRYLKRAGVRVHRAGAHTLRHTCVQRLVDAELSLKTIGDYVGHRSAQSTKIYTKNTKIDLAALREVAMGNGEAL